MASTQKQEIASGDSEAELLKECLPESEEIDV